MKGQVKIKEDQHQDNITAEKEARDNAARSRERAEDAQALENAIDKNIKEIEDKILALDISPGLIELAA